MCAPTGAGKTNVALLSVMQQVAQCMENGVLNREDLKVIYPNPNPNPTTLTLRP